MPTWREIFEEFERLKNSGEKPSMIIAYTKGEGARICGFGNKIACAGLAQVSFEVCKEIHYGYVRKHGVGESIDISFQEITS